MILLCGVIAAHAETLTIATYNVENYVAADRMTEAGFRSDYPKPETQKTALRTVLIALNADVLVLQEMGGQPYFNELRRDLQRSGLDYPHAVLLEGADPDRHVALLSKRPLIGVTCHTAIRFAYLGATELVKRGLLEVTVATSAGRLTIFGLHLKSRFTDRPDDPESVLRRLGEAGAIRDAVLQRFPPPAAERFLVVGDFNDDKSSKTLRRFLDRGAKPVAALLPAADRRGDTWTYTYRKQDSYTRVDHILVSPALKPMVQDGAARIYDGEGVREASDHRPVVVTLILEPHK